MDVTNYIVLLVVSMGLTACSSSSTDPIYDTRAQKAAASEDFDVRENESPVTSLQDPLIEGIREDCGIDLSGVDISNDSDLELFSFQSNSKIDAAGSITELVDLIVTEPRLASFANFILNITRTVAGIENYRLEAQAGTNIAATLSGTTISFAGTIDQLNIDRIENNALLTQTVTDLGNTLATEILTREVRSHFVTIADRVQGRYGDLAASTVCTLQFSDSMTIAGSNNSTVSFDPPIPTAINPFAKAQIYTDQVGSALEFTSEMTIVSTDSEDLEVGNKIPVTMKVEPIDSLQTGYCPNVNTEGHRIFRFSMTAETPEILSKIGVFQELDFFVKQADKGEIFTAIGADPGITIIKDSICIETNP